MIHIKLLEKQEQAKPKTSIQEEIIKTRTKINVIETNKTLYKKSMKEKNCSLKR
jgi:hypothetical protein